MVSGIKNQIQFLIQGGIIMERLLNKLLADLVVEYHKLQSYHWYLKGYHFFDDHPKLESYYDMIIPPCIKN